jgi:hypothetical protein
VLDFQIPGDAHNLRLTWTGLVAWFEGDTATFDLGR